MSSNGSVNSTWRRGSFVVLLCCPISTNSLITNSSSLLTLLSEIKQRVSSCLLSLGKAAVDARKKVVSLLALYVVGCCPRATMHHFLFILLFWTRPLPPQVYSHAASLSESNTEKNQRGS